MVPVSRQCWLVKQEPGEYPWSRLLAEGVTAWTGVRNFQARNHLRSMKLGDLVFFYHSGVEKAVVGLTRVARTARPDPTASEGDWSAVDLKAVRSLDQPVSLATMKADPMLGSLPLVRQSRLSVCPVTAVQSRRLFKLAKTQPPRR